MNVSRSLQFVGLAIVLTFSGQAGSAEDLPPPSRWESDISAFEAADREVSPAPGSILFLGSSSIRMWRTLAADFPQHAVINRGFGGSEISDSIRFLDRIVLPYQPATIVFYAGENDLSAGVTPERVAEDFRTFVSRVHGELPETRIAYISMKPSPSRAHLYEAMVEGNKLIREVAEKTEKVDYIDVFTPMLDAEGKARGELFIKDRLHMNGDGYRLWKGIVGSYLKNIE